MPRRAPKPGAAIPAGATVADYPPLAGQLDPVELPAFRIAARSRKAVQWICDKGPDHSWSAPPYRRISAGAGCPFCAGRRASVTNSLTACFPAIAAELDLEALATSGLTADQIVAGSHRRVGWRCGRCGHRWEATVGPRTDRRRAGCPACAGHVATPSSNLAVARPDLAAQWHPTRNCGLRPETVRPGSAAAVWWLCPVHPDHEWRASPNARTNPATLTGCPACSGYQLSVTNNLAALFPDIAAQFDPSFNGGRRSDQILAGTGEEITWRCDRGPDHVWTVSVVSRTAQGNGCPFCAGKRVSVTNTLALYPQLVSEFESVANAPETAETLSASSRTLVWWRCASGPDHRWRARVSSRALHGHGCPYCAGHRASVTNSLANCCPQAAAGLDPALNRGLRAEQITAGSSRVVTWSCVNDASHTWQTAVRTRVRLVESGYGACPMCQPRGASQRQLALASALAHSLPGLNVDPWPPPVVCVGRRWHPDITVAELRLIIEYDGVYYHQGREDRDVRKSEALRAAGWTVVRLRESPLTALHPHDLPIPILSPAAGERLASILLAHLREVLVGQPLRLLGESLSRAATAPVRPWQWAAPPAARFSQGLNALAAFSVREAHAKPGAEHYENEFPLGRWVLAQRRLHRSGKLSVTQANLLSAMPGWVWDWRQDRWDQFLAALRAFAAREGHLRVPQSYSDGDYRLGQKVAVTRALYHRGRLAAERVRQLEQLPGWAWRADDRTKRHGH